ncbi:hypothetical protein [Clostridium sp.]|uniref:hypothetical protein n=1 Tax=Clostridium sp. TaxID=1506 RepID=UPI003F34E25A
MGEENITRLLEYLLSIENTEPNIILDWGPLTISIISLVVTGILAWRQCKLVRRQKEIAERQLAINLYERRYSIYDKGRKIIDDLIAADKIDYDVTEKVKHMTDNVISESKFLFLNDVTEFLEKQKDIIDKYIEFDYLNYSLNMGLCVNELGIMLNLDINKEVIIAKKKPLIDFFDKIDIDSFNNIKENLEENIDDSNEDIIFKIDSNIELAYETFEMILEDFKSEYIEVFKPYLDFKNIK